MHVLKGIFSAVVFAILVLNIECCNSKSESPQSRAIITSTTPQMTEPLTTTEELPETTTEYVTEIDIETTTIEEDDNGDLPTTLPADYDQLTSNCTGDHVKSHCLNDGTCYRFELTNKATILTCLCTDGYIGERCENFDIDDKVADQNRTIFISVRHEHLDTNSSTTFKVPFAFLAVIVSYVGFQMLTN